MSKKPPKKVERKLLPPDVAEVLRLIANGQSDERISKLLGIVQSDVLILREMSATAQETVTLAKMGPAPDDFSALAELRRIAWSPVTPDSVRVRALGLILRESDARMQVDWGAVKIDEIPEHARHVLAGLLAEYVATPQVDPAFAGAGPAARALFLVVGVLVDDEARASDLLRKHRAHLDALRREAKAANVRAVLEAPTVRFAAEHRPSSRPVIEVEVE
jgi:hypothetical protein